MTVAPEINQSRERKSTMNFSIRTALAAVALASALTIAEAQTTQDQDHAVHHPPTQPQRPAMRGLGQPGMGPRGQQMMMGGNTADMMQMMLPMMRMMMMEPGGMDAAGGPMGMMQPRHIEGRIAFLRTELKITDAQSQQWNAFADALRQSAKAMITMREGMMGGGEVLSAPEQAEREVKLLSARLDAMKAIAAAETALYGVLSDEQKKTADELLSTPMGRM
jgi:hypothetical protein